MRTLVIALLVSLGMVVSARAASGGIVSTQKWAWGTNIGWVNFAPTHGSVTVYDDHLEGYIWAENVGWIRLGTYTGGDAHTYANDASDTYGVNNDGSGNLSGYAWGTNIGWINFNPSHSQVTVDPFSGEFNGYAWGENVGWMHFKNSGTYAYNVVTSLLPSAGPGFVVNTDADTDDGTCDVSNCTLREAINAANADVYDANTITFAANYTITLTSALPDITSNVTIDGEGAANTIVQASTCDPVNLPGGCTPSDWRVFTFTSGTSTLKDMTVRYGNCDVSACSGTQTHVGGNIFAENASTNLTLDAVHVQSGYADNYGGGVAIWGGGNLVIQNNSLIGGSGKGNKSDGDGGGVYFLNSGDLTIDNSEVSYNLGGYGGGVEFEDGDTITIQNGSLIDHNTSSSDGGGVYAFASTCQLIIDSSTISNNTTTNNSPGGGLETGCETTINNSTISGNIAEDSQGGGIYVDSSTNVTITNSTIANNQTGAGGGIYNRGSLTVVNSAFYNNPVGGYGGGLHNISGATATLINNTFSDHSSDYGDGIYNAGTLHLSNNIIANGTTNNNCVNAGGTISTNVNNLIEDNWTCGTPASTADPMLGPLANNGGPTQTMALLLGSPAIDAGDDTVCADANTVNNKDQRGVTRPEGAHCDIGAYEIVQTNDEFYFATDVASLSYTDSMDTSSATSDSDDPDLAGCSISGSGKATVWYEYSPSVASAIALDTKTADYDTFIAVWTGTRNNLTLVACNDDTNGTKQSALAFQVVGGTTYYIEIGQP